MKFKLLILEFYGIYSIHFSVIFEARGVISSDKRDWQSAYTNFSQSFKHYYDCGSLNKAKDLLM